MRACPASPLTDARAHRLPAQVGDEVSFIQAGNKKVEGIVLDIGWYRTQIRSFEREVWVIPNSVFSKNVVLNVSRKNREWRLFESMLVRVGDVHKVGRGAAAPVLCIAIK